MHPTNLTISSFLPCTGGSSTHDRRGDGAAAAAAAGTTGLFLASGSAVGAWAGCIPALKLGLVLSDAALGLALLAFAAGAILAMPSAGWLGLRFGSHRVALAAGGLLAVGLLGPGWAASLPALIAAALLIGAANGLIDVAINAHATSIERAWRSPIMSSFHAAFSLGGLAGAAFARRAAGARAGRRRLSVGRRRLDRPLVAAALFAGIDPGDAGAARRRPGGGGGQVALAGPTARNSASGC